MNYSILKAIDQQHIDYKYLVSLGVYPHTLRLFAARCVNLVLDMFEPTYVLDTPKEIIETVMTLGGILPANSEDLREELCQISRTAPSIEIRNAVMAAAWVVSKWEPEVAASTAISYIRTSGESLLIAEHTLRRVLRESIEEQFKEAFRKIDRRAAVLATRRKKRNA